MSDPKAEPKLNTTNAAAIVEAIAMEARVRELTKEHIRKRRQTNEHARY